VLKVLQENPRTAVRDEDFRTSMTRSLSTVAYLDRPEFASAWQREVARIQGSVRFIAKGAE